VYANAKMIPVEMGQRMWGGGAKKSGGGGEFRYDIFDTLQKPL
jgi:hypothetical protein